ncbi:MAG: hypothetical protein AAB567_02080 [Patescibacteria group bacterium]
MQKNIFSIGIYLVLVFMTTVSLTNFAFAGHGTGEHVPPGQELPEGPQTGRQLLELVKAITDWIFVVFLLTAVIFIILAAFQFLTGGGDPGKLAEARNKLIYAAVAIAVALMARGIPVVVKNIVGV